jgi:hypothetical protein
VSGSEQNTTPHKSLATIQARYSRSQEESERKRVEADALLQKIRRRQQVILLLLLVLLLLASSLVIMWKT